MVLFLLANFSILAQTLSYADQAVLLSGDDYYGTARFTGMSGAFGALGNNMTAVDINPAGLAVYNVGESSMTLAYRNTDIQSTFYGNRIDNSDEYFRFSQIGGAMVWNNTGHPELVKVALGFNYNVIKDFNNNYVAQGNSGVPEFLDDPFLNYDDDPDNDVFYTNVEDQYFYNYTSGIHDRFSFSFGGMYKDVLYFGASMAFFNVDFYQNTIYKEFNNDGNDNTLDAYNDQSLSTYGNGFNFGLGLIYKPINSLRIGAAYQSPVWYDLTERYIEYLDIIVSNNEEIYVESYDPNFYDYELKTAGKFIGSLAVVFGQFGLLSMDYTYQPYSSTKLKPTSIFNEENQFLDNGLASTHSFRFGTEWRVGMLSLRGGYRISESPYKSADSDYDLHGYSLGLGLRFTRWFTLDFAYDQSTFKDQYQFIHIEGVRPAELDVTNSRFTSSLLINF